MSPRRWITAFVLTAVVLGAMLILNDVHEQLSDPSAGFDLTGLDDEAVGALRAAIGPFPDRPCDPTIPGRDLPEDHRRACNRHYLAVVKAARAAGYAGTRIRDVREPAFYRRLVEAE